MLLHWLREAAGRDPASPPRGVAPLTSTVSPVSGWKNLTMCGFIAMIFLICVMSAQLEAVSRDIPRNSAAGEGRGETSGKQGNR